jgi:hypothetical protein
LFDGRCTVPAPGVCTSMLQRLKVICFQHTRAISAIAADFMQPLHALSAFAVGWSIRNSIFKKLRGNWTLHVDEQLACSRVNCSQATFQT